MRKGGGYFPFRGDFHKPLLTKAQIRQVSMSPTFYEQFFRTKLYLKAFVYSQIMFVKTKLEKVAPIYKILLKLTTALSICCSILPTK